jgi:hypothetical protein
MPLRHFSKTFRLQCINFSLNFSTSARQFNRIDSNWLKNCGTLIIISVFFHQVFFCVVLFSGVAQIKWWRVRTEKNKGALVLRETGWGEHEQEEKETQRFRL